MTERIKTGLMIVLVMGLWMAICSEVVNQLTIPYGGTKADRVLKEVK